MIRSLESRTTAERTNTTSSDNRRESGICSHRSRHSGPEQVELSDDNQLLAALAARNTASWNSATITSTGVRVPGARAAII